MIYDLHLRAKALLAAQHNKLMFDPNAQVKKSQSLNDILAWCENVEFSPGKWLKAKQSFRFEFSQIEKIEQILLEQGYASIFAKFDQDTHRSTATRNPYEKQGKIKPTHHLVLAAVTNQAGLDAIGHCFYPSPQANLELDVSKLVLKNFGCLVVVENRDSFNDWFVFKAKTNLPNPLVIYRGDKHHSSACKALLRNWKDTQQHKPAIYFGDCDLAGLRIATSAGYSHLLLPELTWLTNNLIQPHFPDNQYKYLARLQRDCPSQWLPILHLMEKKRAGLRQQKMYQIVLKLYPCD